MFGKRVLSKIIRFNKNICSVTTVVNNGTNKSSVEKLVEYLEPKKINETAVFKVPGTIYDPPYLNKEKPFPNYEELAINLYSYDYISLDGFYKYVASLCKNLDIDVVDYYAMPYRIVNLKTYKPFSTTLDHDYKIFKYHRVVRLANLKSSLAPILYEAIQLNLPEGVQLHIDKPSEQDEEFRYIPDTEIQELKKSLNELEDEKKKK